MIMAHYHCGADQAFRILTAVSSTTNLKVRDIAAHLVDQATRGAKLSFPHHPRQWSDPESDRRQR